MAQVLVLHQGGTDTRNELCTQVNTHFGGLVSVDITYQHEFSPHTVKLVMDRVEASRLVALLGKGLMEVLSR